MWVKDEVEDVVVEGVEALPHPHDAGGDEALMDGAEEASHGGAGGRGVEALEHVLDDVVHSVAQCHHRLD